MPQIRPVSDLRNNFAEISRTVHESSEPVILTKNGYGDMVVIAYDAFERLQHEMMVTNQLQAAELEAETTEKRFSHQAVMHGLRAKLEAVKKGRV